MKQVGKSFHLFKVLVVGKSWVQQSRYISVGFNVLEASFQRFQYFPKKMLGVSCFLWKTVWKLSEMASLNNQHTYKCGNLTVNVCLFISFITWIKWQPFCLLNFFVTTNLWETPWHYNRSYMFVGLLLVFFWVLYIIEYMESDIRSLHHTP